MQRIANIISYIIKYPTQEIYNYLYKYRQTWADLKKKKKKKEIRKSQKSIHSNDTTYIII